MDGYIIALIAVGCVVVCLIAWGVWENHAVQCNSVEVASEKLPAAFDGFTFAHISDLHNAKFGRGQKNLLARLRESAPDAIVITGDLIDKRRPGMRRALRFAELAVKIAPVYYVGSVSFWRGFRTRASRRRIKERSPQSRRKSSGISCRRTARSPHSFPTAPSFSPSIGRRASISRSADTRTAGSSAFRCSAA